MRPVLLVVGGTPIGNGKTWAYPAGESLGTFIVPIYNLDMIGTDENNNKIKFSYSVYRFGMHCSDGKTAKVVGLAEKQEHVIKSWIPTYSVHSSTSIEDGAWQVYDNFLIHDGPDNPNSNSGLYASIGCIEILGKNKFNDFNDKIIQLAAPQFKSRTQNLISIAATKSLKIRYEKADRPLPKHF